MKKVLVVITSGLGREGITSAALETFRNMDLSGLAIDVVDVAGAKADVVKDFEDLGCRVIALPNRKKQLGKYRKALKKLVKQEGYDVVHVHGSSALLSIELSIAKKFGVKKRIAHSHNTQNSHRLVDKLLRPYFYKQFTCALACGQDAGKFLFGKKAFTVFHNGNDFNKFKFCKRTRDDMKDKYGLHGNFVLGFVGGLREQKNPLFLIDILKETLKVKQNVKLLVVGDGPLRSEFLKYASDCGVSANLVMAGTVTNVYDLVQAMDVALLPSLFEGLPVVATEWQASGVKCLFSDKVTPECAPTELVKFLPIDKGAKIWAQEIVELSADYDREVASKNAREVLAQNGFEIKESARRLKNIYLDNN